MVEVRQEAECLRYNFGEVCLGLAALPLTFSAGFELWRARADDGLCTLEGLFLTEATPWGPSVCRPTLTIWGCVLV